MKGTFTRFACLALAISLALPRPVLAADLIQSQDSEIGYVLMQEYLGAMGERVGGESEELTYKRDVYSGQIVRTKGQSMTALRFLDDSVLQVGQLSEVVLDEFIYDPDKRTGQVMIEFTEGIFRFGTGEMTNLRGYDLRTPTAVMDIRGADFKVGIDDTGATTVAVMAGEVEVFSREACYQRLLKDCESSSLMCGVCAGEGGVTATAGQGVSVSATGEVSGMSSGDEMGFSNGSDDLLDLSLSFGNTTVPPEQHANFSRQQLRSFALLNLGWGLTGYQFQQRSDGMGAGASASGGW